MHRAPEYSSGGGWEEFPWARYSFAEVIGVSFPSFFYAGFRCCCTLWRFFVVYSHALNIMGYSVDYVAQHQNHLIVVSYELLVFFWKAYTIHERVKRDFLFLNSKLKRGTHTYSREMVFFFLFF